MRLVAVTFATPRAPVHVSLTPVAFPGKNGALSCNPVRSLSPSRGEDCYLPQ
jgi:hypothetical protein